MESIYDRWNTNKDGKVSWIEFREGLNNWQWGMTDRERLNEVVEGFFK